MEFDYDNIDDWAPRLSALLTPLLPTDIGARVKAADPEYVEDARDMVLRNGDKAEIVAAMLDWLRASTVTAYHGTRVTAQEAASIESEGFRPLKIAERHTRLKRALSRHPKWPTAEKQFGEVVAKFEKGYAGNREGQVHFTLSRGGLESFDHYITHGSEADQRMAHALIGNDAVELLALDGVRTVYKIGVPGEVALKLTHRWFSPEDMMARGDLPNVVDETLKAWAFRFVRPEYQSRNLQVDCGLIFYEAVPASLILSKEILEEPNPEP